MSKAKLEYARELIQEKRYEEARSVLREINHPTAVKWLQRLDEIAPPPKKRKQTRMGCWIAVFASIIPISIAILTDPRATAPQSPSSAARPTAPSEPAMVEIDDPYSTGLPEAFLSAASEAVAPHGNINWYAAEINADRRLIASVEATLTSAPQRSTALQVIEDLLRQYADATTDQNAGRIDVLVSWLRGTITCSDNAGVGFRVMQEIDWATADQQAIFRAIDRDLYGDDLDGAAYGSSAWAPDPSPIRDCSQ